MVQKDCVRDYLSKLDTHKSMGPDGMHSRETWQMSLLSHSPSSLKGPGGQEKCLRTGGEPVLPQSSKRARRRNYRMVGLTSIPGKVMEQLILDVIIKQVEEKKVRSSQHGFTKGKSCLTNLIAFYDGMTSWVDEGRAVDVVTLTSAWLLTLCPITSS